MPDSWRPIRFIDAEIRVSHAEPPTLRKKPGPPDSFDWNDRRFPVLELLSSWIRYERRGRMGANLQPAHLKTAGRRGSWGVGRFYFRVRTPSGVFDLYYDRAPEGAGDRSGHWVLWRELAQAPTGDRR
jgi:hypothetical protein